jgi:hypothetical protein
MKVKVSFLVECDNPDYKLDIDYIKSRFRQVYAHIHPLKFFSNLQCDYLKDIKIDIIDYTLPIEKKQFDNSIKHENYEIVEKEILDKLKGLLNNLIEYDKEYNKQAALHLLITYINEQKYIIENEIKYIFNLSKWEKEKIEKIEIESNCKPFEIELDKIQKAIINNMQKLILEFIAYDRKNYDGEHLKKFLEIVDNKKIPFKEWIAELDNGEINNG